MANKYAKTRRISKDLLHIEEHIGNVREAIKDNDFRTADVHAAMAYGMIITARKREEIAERKKERGVKRGNIAG